jgi:transketolase
MLQPPVSSVEMRRTILEMAFAGQSVHIPSAFSIVEIVATLHNSCLNYPGNNPSHADRDYFVLSKGHGIMALYAALAFRGWITKEVLQNYFKDGSRLPGLCESTIPGCEANTGSLGQGIGVAAGLALGSKLKGSNQKVYCLVGDGELNEGSSFEALSFIGQRQLTNFALIVDLNGFQAMGKTQEIISQVYLKDFLGSLHFDVHEVDGHSEQEIQKSLSEFQSDRTRKPIAIIARTVKGKGVSFMENNNAWHYQRLSEETLRNSLIELERQGA